jgi:hypothetical protein
MGPTFSAMRFDAEREFDSTAQPIPWLDAPG